MAAASGTFYLKLKRKIQLEDFKTLLHNKMANYCLRHMHTQHTGDVFKVFLVFFFESNKWAPRVSNTLTLPRENYLETGAWWWRCLAGDLWMAQGRRIYRENGRERRTKPKTSARRRTDAPCGRCTTTFWDLATDFCLAAVNTQHHLALSRLII